MTFIDDEKSIHDGEPVELYKFVGSAVTFFLTSHVEDILFMGDTYTAVPIQRGNIKINADLSRQELEIQMPISQALAQAYAFNVAPRDLELQLFRMHPFTGNNAKIWQGKVQAWTVGGRLGKALVPSVLSEITETTIPGRYYQSQCNHTFGDDRCGIKLNSQFYQTSVISLNPDDVTIGLQNAVPKPGWAVGGEIVRLLDAERRMIVSSEGKTIRINWPFVALDVTDNVFVFRGCDRSLTTCHNDFDNHDRFGGYPYIPNRNVFVLGLAASTNTTVNFTG